MTAVSVLTDRAASAIGDPNLRRWNAGDWLDYLNDGRRALVALVPQAGAVNKNFLKLDAGSKQSLDAGDITLVRIVRNMGTDGKTPGRAITHVRMQDLDDADPNWHTMTPTSEVKHFMWESLDPLVYYTYPPNDGTGYVEANVFTTPVDADANGDSGVLGVYDPFLVHYMLFRAYGRNTDTASQSESTRYYNLFLQISPNNGPQQHP